MAAQNPDDVTRESPDQRKMGFIGKHVGNYVVTERLGEGGMGEVYLAEHPTLGRKVAVKFLARRFNTDPAVAERFMSEARTLASLRHPNIVDIFDFGELDGRLYYVMEHLQGRDLETVMSQRGRFSVTEAGAYVQQVCAALEAAHCANVVHRDLKPANIFVLDGPSLHIKLMDFGIAKVLHGDSEVSKTSTGQVLGTPTHMAPEQALSHHSWICAQTDLYALGCILYEMLAGRPVFQHSSVILLLSAHVKDPITPLRTIEPSVPEPVAQLVEQCLHKHPQDRPQSARVVALRFETALLEAGLRSTPSPARGLDLPPPSPSHHSLVTAPGPAPNIVVTGDEPDISACATSATILSDSATALDARPPKPRTSVRPRKSKRPAAQSVDSAAPSRLTSPDRSSPAAAPHGQTLSGSPAAVTLGAQPDESPADVTAVANQTVLSDGENAAIAKVLARMQRAGDFPAFVKNVTVISRKAEVEGAASAAQLADAILKDYALTAKLLRIVNSSLYDRFGKKINNVSRAVVVLGFDQVRSLALGISIFRNPGNRPHAKHLADLSIGSLVSGEIARKVAHRGGLKDPEEAMICAMFQNLGQHLVVYYLPEAYDQIVALMQSESIDVSAASERVLGVSLRKLGIGIIQKWRLSPRVVAAMVPGPPSDGKPKTDEERLRQLSSFANELSDTVSNAGPEERGAALSALLERYKHVVDVPKDKLDEFLGSVQESFTERYSSLLGLQTRESKFFKNADDWRGIATSAGGEPSQARAPRASPGVHAPAPIDPSAELLARRVEAIATRLKGRHEPEEVLKAVLDAYVYGLGFRRMLALMPDRTRANLVVRVAGGEDADTLKHDFSVPLAPLGAADVFSSTYHGMKATVVDDAFDDKMTRRVPRIYYEMIGSPAFALYACGGRGLPVTILFGDVDSAERLPKPEHQVHLARLRELVGRITLSGPKDRGFRPYG